jgi:hypothetical protein
MTSPPLFVPRLDSDMQAATAARGNVARVDGSTNGPFPICAIITIQSNRLGTMQGRLNGFSGSSK